VCVCAWNLSPSVAPGKRIFLTFYYYQFRSFHPRPTLLYNAFRSFLSAHTYMCTNVYHSCVTDDHIHTHTHTHTHTTQSCFSADTAMTSVCKKYRKDDNTSIIFSRSVFCRDRFRFSPYTRRDTINDLADR